MKPLVSVIMPVYNSALYLREAIESILHQTFQNLELIILNDGSTDSSLEIIKSYAEGDKRIKIFDSKINLGIVKQLNLGVKVAEGKFIARMDSDDIACRERLEKQLNFLEENREVGILGTSTVLINKGSEEIGGSERMESSYLVLFSSYFINPFAHPTVMIRREVFERIGLYNENRYPSEDYDFWIRASKVTKFYNLKDPLLYYRVHPKSITQMKSAEQKSISGIILQDHVEKLIGHKPDFNIISFLKGFHKNSFHLNEKDFLVAFNIISKIYFSFLQAHPIINRSEKSQIQGFVFQRLLFLALNIRRQNKLMFIICCAKLAVFNWNNTVKFLYGKL